MAFPMKTLGVCICPFMTSLSQKKIGIRHLHSKNIENENPTRLLNTILYTSYKRVKNHFSYGEGVSFKELKVDLLKCELLLSIQLELFITKVFFYFFKFNWTLQRSLIDISDKAKSFSIFISICCCTMDL